MHCRLIIIYSLTLGMARCRRQHFLLQMLPHTGNSNPLQFYFLTFFFFLFLHCRLSLESALTAYSDGSSTQQGKWKKSPQRIFHMHYRSITLMLVRYSWMPRWQLSICSHYHSQLWRFLSFFFSCLCLRFHPAKLPKTTKSRKLTYSVPHFTIHIR